MMTATAGGSPSGNSIIGAINDPGTTTVINDSRLSGNVARLNAANNWMGANSFNGNQSITGNINATGSVSANTLTVDTNTLQVAGDTHRVGIGAQTPGFKLHVSDAGNTGLRVETATSGGTVASFGGSGDFSIDAVNIPGGRLIVKESGRVGVGTGFPQQNLSVNGALNLDQANANTGSLNPGLTFGSLSGEGIASRRTAGTNQFGLDFYTSAINRMSITGAGRIGLGTNAPLAKLDIQAGANGDGTSDPVAIAFQHGSGGFRHWIRTRHNANPGSGNAIDFFVNNSATNAGSLAPGNGSLHVLTLDSGRVGIGTQNPAYKLHVSNAGSTALRVENTTNGGTLASFGGSGDFSIDAVGVSGGRLIVKEGGNVGVGNNNPGDKLSVAGTVSASGGYKFADGTLQTTAVGDTYTSFRTDSLEIPANNSAAVSEEHLDLPAGNYAITATANFINSANIGFQDNSREVVCSLGEGYFFILSGVGGGNTETDLTIHTVKSLNQPGSIDLTCRANSGGTDRSFVNIRTRRLTATRVGNIFSQP
jgi:hypothetical protein